MVVLQGTTPKLEIEIPQDIPVTSLIGVELTIRHKSEQTIYSMADVTVDSEANTITYKFTERQTLALDPKHPLYWQLRLKTAGDIFGTGTYEVDVKDLMSEEEMA